MSTNQQPPDNKPGTTKTSVSVPKEDQSNLPSETNSVKNNNPSPAPNSAQAQIDQKKKKSAKFASDVFMTPELLNRSFPAPKELDLFGLETGARKTIAELFKPMMDDMERDRRNVVSTQVTMEQIIDRIVKLEYVCSMQGSKPKVFQDLDNRFIDLDITIQASQADIMSKVDQNKEHNDDLKQQIKEVENQLQIVNNLIMVRDKQLAELRELTDEVRMATQETQSLVVTRTGQIEDRAQGMITNQELIINTLKGQIAVFEKKIEGMQTQVQKVFDQQNANAISIMELGEVKLNTVDWEAQVQDHEQKMEKIRYATYDTFRVQKSTDNYIEKYLPFVCQNMISQNLSAIFRKRPLDYIDKETGQVVQVNNFGEGKTKFSEIETFEFELHDRFKDNEYQIYKERHAVVLNDLGVSNLKKSAFRMPGYKRVVGDTMNEYEIDNEVLNKQFNMTGAGGDPNNQITGGKSDHLQYFIPEEISNTECSFDADEERRRLNPDMESESGVSQISIEYHDCTDEPGAGGERTQAHIEKQQVLNIDAMMRDTTTQERPRSPFLDRQLNLIAHQGIASNSVEQSEMTLQKTATFDSRALSKKVKDSPMLKKQLSASPFNKQSSQTASKHQPKLTRKNETEAAPNFAQTATAGDLDAAKTQGLHQKIRRKTSHAQVNLMRYPSLGATMNKNGTLNQRTPEKAVDLDLYHERRQATGYRVGFDDLERPVTKQIQDSTQEIYMIKEKIKELQKEIIDYKKYLEVQNNSRDTKFQTEVRECLTQQLTYINEIQNEMLKEIDVNKKQFHEINWQIAKMETSLEEAQGGGAKLNNVDVNQSKVGRQSRGSPRASPHHSNATSVKQDKLKVVRKDANPQSTSSVQQDILMRLQQSFSGQTSELEIDFIKLQNIINFELLKRVKLFEGMTVGTVSGALRPATSAQSKDTVTLNSAEGLIDDTNSLLNSAAKVEFNKGHISIEGEEGQVEAKVREHTTNVLSVQNNDKVDCNVVVQMIDNVRSKLEILLENNQAQMQATLTANDGTTQMDSPQHSNVNQTPNLHHNNPNHINNTITSPIMSHDTLLSTGNMNTLRFSGGNKMSMQNNPHGHQQQQLQTLNYNRPQSSKQLRQKAKLQRNNMMQSAGMTHQAMLSGGHLTQTHMNQHQKLVVTATSNHGKNHAMPKKIGLPLPLVAQSSARDTMSMQCSNRSNALKIQLGVL